MNIDAQRHFDCGYNTEGEARATVELKLSNTTAHSVEIEYLHFEVLQWLPVPCTTCRN